MIGGWFEAVFRAGLRLTPEGFRRRYGDEAVEVALSRMSRRPRWTRPAAAVHELVDLLSTIRRERRADRTRGDGVRARHRYLNDLHRDVRYAVRALIKAPGFALVGIVSMGIGLGLTTWVYNGKWQVIFRGLPSARNAVILACLALGVVYAVSALLRPASTSVGGGDVASFTARAPGQVPGTDAPRTR